MKRTKFLWAGLLFWGLQSNAQSYSAIHGSNYSGSLGVYNNPSSIVTSPYRWDLTLLGLQYQLNSNAITGRNFPLYLLPSSKFYYIANGDFERKADMNFNVKLLNGRYSIDKSSAFAFGINLRGYSQGKTSAVNYLDTTDDSGDFLSANRNKIIGVDVTSSIWTEVYGSYARTVVDNEIGKLNAGATIKMMRGMSGIFARVNNVGIEQVADNDRTIYKITNGSARYGYSANHGNGESFEASDLFTGSRTSFAMDLGVEYIVKTQAVTNIYDEGTDNDYEWKIGLSVLDLGWNSYDYSSESRLVSSLKEDVFSETLEQKFNAVKNVGAFNDSLATIVNQSNTIAGIFDIKNPARVVLNVDRYVSGNFYINGELSLNLAADGKNNIAVKESKLVTITPRWETSRRGLYFPVQYTREGYFWVGAAAKLGPVLFGTHNLLNFFSTNGKMTGGGFIALIFHPSDFIKDPSQRQYECPKY